MRVVIVIVKKYFFFAKASNCSYRRDAPSVSCHVKSAVDILFISAAENILFSFCCTLGSKLLRFLFFLLLSCSGPRGGVAFFL